MPPVKKTPVKKTARKTTAATPAKKPAGTPASKTASKKPAPNTKAPAGSYALPGGGPGGADAYPVNTKARGANALSRVAANGTPAEKAKVRAAVKSKYPDLPSSKGTGNSQAAGASGKKKKTTTAAKPRARKS